MEQISDAGNDTTGDMSQVMGVGAEIGHVPDRTQRIPVLQSIPSVRCSQHTEKSDEA